MPRLSAALIFLFVAAAALADWETVSTKTELSTAPGVEHRHVVLDDSETGNRATLELALFPAKSCALRVIDNPDGAGSLAEAMEHNKCVAGVNGGYFDPNFAPIGLRIVDGKLVVPLVRARLLSGVLASSAAGIQIMRVAEFSRRAKLDAAIASGPFVVDLGAKVRGLNDTRAARRSFAAIDWRDRAAVGFCSAVTLADLARVLAAQSAGDFKIHRALNLDGGSSSAFWFRRKDGSDFSIPEQKNVRDFVGVVPR